MYNTVTKHDGHLRTRGKCRQHEPQASVFYISWVFSNVRSGLSQCKTRLRLLHLPYDIEVMWRKTIKHAFSMFYTLIKHGFLTNQSVCRVQSILLIYLSIYIYIYQHCTDEAQKAETVLSAVSYIYIYILMPFPVVEDTYYVVIGLRFPSSFTGR